MTAAIQHYDAAIYCRISKEDGDKEISNSIVNQKSIILDFLKNAPEIKVVSVKIDDGYSGKNFDRPAFQEMLNDIMLEKVNCIVVKDLSRFSRNYIDAGQYLDYIFPERGIRFIAVNDGVDTIDKNMQFDGILVPFKNLINDFYLSDISRKTRGSLETKRKRGDFVSAFSFYGYKKECGNKNQLVIDDEAADIVKEIFRWKLSGKSNSGIANILNQKGVLSPLEYKKAMGITINSHFKKRPQAQWHPQTVDQLLQNEVYTGVLAQGKTETINYKVKERLKKDKKNWIRCEGTHEPIISKWLFDRVNYVMKMDTRAAPGADEVYLFSGIVYCANCGYNLVRSRVEKKEKEYIYLICQNYKNKNRTCSSHRISQKQLESCITWIIKQGITQWAYGKESYSAAHAGNAAQNGILGCNRASLVTLIDKVLVYQRNKIKILFHCKDCYQRFTDKKAGE